MSGDFSIAAVLEGAICVQLVLFTLYLGVGARRQVAAPYYLAGVTGCVTVASGLNLLIRATGWQGAGVAVLFADLLIPALVFLYVRAIREPERRIAPQDALYAVPAAGSALVWMIAPVTTMDPVVLTIWGAFLAAAVVLYFRRRSLAGWTPVDRFAGGLLTVSIAVTVARTLILADVAQGRPFLVGAPYIGVLIVAQLATSLALFTALRQQHLLVGGPPRAKYSTAVPEASADSVADRLAAFFAEPDQRLAPELTLGHLAASLDVPSRLLSQVINDRYGVNVATLLNRRRVETAKRLLSETRESIKTVMYDAGFQSKSIFNREFRRHVGVSPSEFRDRLRA